MTGSVREGDGAVRRRDTTGTYLALQVVGALLGSRRHDRANSNNGS